MSIWTPGRRKRGAVDPLVNPPAGGGGGGGGGGGTVPGHSLFLNAPSTADGWTVIWDSDWLYSAEDAASGMIPSNNGQYDGALGGTAQKTYEFRSEGVTPWGTNKAFHTLKHPAGMSGGYPGCVVFPRTDGDPNAANARPLSWNHQGVGDLFLGFFWRPRGSGGQPWTLENLPGMKMIYVQPTPFSGTGGFAHIFIRKWGTKTGGGHAAFEPQPSGTVCTSDAYTASGGPLCQIENTWQKYEYLLTANTRTSSSHLANGGCSIWVDNVLALQRTNANYYCTGQQNATMNKLTLNPIYGGGLTPPPYDLYHDYGRMLVMVR